MELRKFRWFGKGLHILTVYGLANVMIFSTKVDVKNNVQLTKSPAIVPIACWLLPFCL